MRKKIVIDHVQITIKGDKSTVRIRGLGQIRLIMRTVRLEKKWRGSPNHFLRIGLGGRLFRTLPMLRQFASQGICQGFFRRASKRRRT